MTDALALHHVDAAYPGRPLWRDWSQRWTPGAHLVIGDDGSGKTTLLHLLAGAQAPKAGQITRSGLDSVRDAATWRAQTFWHDPRAEDAALAQVPASAWLATLVPQYPDWDEAAWAQHVEGWQLQPHLHKPFVAHSTGTRRKLWMAAALASGAPLTLIDEPIAGLDRGSLGYLATALNRVGSGAASPRWVIVAHYDELPGVGWESVTTLPETPD